MLCQKAFVPRTFWRMDSARTKPRGCAELSPPFGTDRMLALENFYEDHDADAVWHPIVVRLLSISKSVRGLSGYMLAEVGLHPGQDAMILALASGTSLSVTELADALGVRPSTVSKMADRLLKCGYLLRKRDETDKRTTSISLTPEGLALREKLLALHARLEPNSSKPSRKLMWRP
jgi:DNA-binding MarR family transcriptional regulator